MKHTKRILAMLLTVLMLVSVVPLGMMNASAETSYPKIEALNISRVYQSNSSAGLCTWCSMATVQGYCLGEYSYDGKSNSYRVPGTEYEYGATKGKRDAVTEYLRDNFNGYYNTSANLKKYPFPMVMKKNPGADVYQIIYNQLKAGKPVIVYRKARNSNDSNHASVVIAYNGSSSKLEPSGFTVMEINRNVTKNSATLFEKYANNPQTKYSTSCYIKLSTWLDGREVLHIIYPKAETISASKTLTVILRDTTHIGTNAATVHLTAWNPEKKLVTARGVQVKKKGASSWAKTYSEDLSKKDYNKNAEITGYFDIGSGKEVNYALSAGTTYEYRCFVTSGGKNYYSNISTFTTKPDNKPTVTLRPVDHIETNAATVHLTAKNPGKLLVTARGVQVKKKGASSWAKTYSEDLSKKTYNKDTEITGYFDIGSGKEVNYALSAGTTYEYRCFVTSGGTNYYSSVSTFTTLPAQTSNADPYFKKVYSSGISDTNATINAEFSSLTSVKSTGFYFGTSESSLKKITMDLKGKADSAGKVKTIYFGLNGWYGKLTPGTTYYYKIFYTNSSGKECASNVYSFITTGTTTYNFTVKYDANGGKGTMAQQSVKGGQVLVLTKNTFTKQGYTFSGWNVKRGSDSKWYVAGQGWKTQSEITKNKWEKKPYDDGGSYTFDSSWSNGAKTDDTFTFVAVWKACAHTWDGGVVTKEPTTSATGVMTYTCEICGKTKTEKIPVLSIYQIKFNANGGKGAMAAMRVDVEEDFILPENQFTKAGYTFAGWTVKRSSDGKWYVPNEGWKTTKEIKDNGWSKKVYESGEEYRFNAGWINGTKTSDTYTFYAVWKTCEHEWDEGVVTKEPTTSATGVMTYTCEICGKTKTAKIPKISTYQIKFNANGGKGSIAGMKVEKEESFTLPENSFTKAGYTFVGWTVKRSSDSKWLVEEDGWQTNNEIKANDYEKLLFDEDVDLALDDEWINSSKATDTYTFYAMWEKDV